MLSGRLDALALAAGLRSKIQSLDGFFRTSDGARAQAEGSAGCADERLTWFVGQRFGNWIMAARVAGLRWSGNKAPAVLGLQRAAEEQRDGEREFSFARLRFS